MAKSFIAYPSVPPTLGETIERAKRESKADTNFQITTWKRDDLAGSPVIAPILESIVSHDVTVADITVLNFNVLYELGYGIGLGKRGLPILNSAFEFDRKKIESVGIFDSLIYETYSTSADLIGHLRRAEAGRRIATDYPADPLPLYIIVPPVPTDDSNFLIDRARRAGLRPRTFDPSEQARLSATEAVRAVAVSAGVVLPLLSENMRDATIHNMRIAFVAGVAHALNKPTLLLRKGTWPTPLDIRDAAIGYDTHEHLGATFSAFAEKVHEARYADQMPSKGPSNRLASIRFGDPAAENEETLLNEYFLERDEFRQVLDGRASIVVGRKGSGKTAVFYQARNRLREARANVVLDLSPEAYQLRKFKDVVLRCLADGSKEFLLSAFWEYVLLLEICGKIIEKDEDVHKRNHNLYEPYQRLLRFYRAESSTQGVSFSDRLLRLIENISFKYTASYGPRENVDLSDGQVTNLLYETTLSDLRQHLVEYAKNKKLIFLLFDNIDKGWNATGLEESDVVMIRTLIDATRTLGNDFRRSGTDFFSAVFLRNDVYESLLSQTSDRGKDSTVLVDWVRADLLAQLVKKRLSAGDRTVSAENIWHSICAPLINGQDSLQYLISLSLMRPRYLLRLLNHCRGNAINFGRDRMDEDDVSSGLSTYSTEVTKEIGLEIRDVLPEAEGVLYVFLGEKRELLRADIMELLKRAGLSDPIANAAFAMLLWHGVLGLKRDNNAISYIHDVNYDISRLTGLIAKLDGGNPLIAINPAFWPNLEIK
jgi:hypothetical protein